MRQWIIAGALVLGAMPAFAQVEDMSSPWLDWVKKNSPYGFDITYDGTIWINMMKPGQTDDYAIRAGDLREARQTKNRYPVFWVRGYHAKNPKVGFRESKGRYTLNCSSETIVTNVWATYDKDQNQLSRQESSTTSYIVPGTYAAEYYRLFCLVTE